MPEHCPNCGSHLIRRVDPNDPNIYTCGTAENSAGKITTATCKLRAAGVKLAEAQPLVDAAIEMVRADEAMYVLIKKTEGVIARGSPVATAEKRLDVARISFWAAARKAAKTGGDDGNK